MKARHLLTGDKLLELMLTPLLFLNDLTALSVYWFLTLAQIDSMSTILMGVKLLQKH
jgi:hypothetical protein